MNTTGTFKRFLALLLLSVCLVSFSYASSNYSCNSYEECPSECCSNCYGFEVGADFIYWKPCLNGLDYAILFDGDPTESSFDVDGRYKYLHTGFEPGFRVRGAVTNLWCSSDITGSYTRLKSNDRRETGLLPNQTLFTTNIHDYLTLPVTSVIAELDFEYQTFDVLFESTLCFNSCNYFIPFVGIEGLKIDQEMIVDASSLVITDFTMMMWDSEIKALGLKIGAEYEFKFCGGLEWFTRGSFSVLAGSHKASNLQLQEVQNEGIIATEWEFITDENACLPGYHLATGLRYSDCICGIKFSFQIGYEFLDWWNVSQPRRFVSGVDEIGDSTTSLANNLTLHGMFVGIDIGY